MRLQTEYSPTAANDPMPKATGYGSLDDASYRRKLFNHIDLSLTSGKGLYDLTQ
jgi:hypothetical protein